MEGFKDWAMTMAAIVVLGSMCEVLLPEGSFQKYVRLAIGLVLVMSLVSPLKGCSRAEVTVPELEEPVYQTREMMASAQQKDVAYLYRRNLESKMLSLLNQELDGRLQSVTCQVEEVKEETFGTIQTVTVTVNGSDSGETVQTIEQLLNRNFGVDEDSVSVLFLEEKNEW